MHDLSVAQVEVACALEIVAACTPYPHDDIATWRLMSVKSISEYAHAFAVAACAPALCAQADTVCSKPCVGSSHALSCPTADAVISSSLPHEAAQQTLEACRAIVGGEIVCDPEPCARKRWVASEVHNHDSDLDGIPGMTHSSESELDIGEGRNHQDEESSDSESDCDAGFENLLSSALHLGKPPAHFLDKELKFLASRGGGIDGSDDFMSAPPPALLLPDGDEQSMSVDISDIPL